MQTMCIWAAITGEGWAIMTYITMTVFYVLIKQHIRREVCKKNFNMVKKIQLKEYSEECKRVLREI